MKIKNSNKVLILVLMLTVAIPFLIAQVFVYKIKNNQFVYEKHRQEPYEGHPELNMTGSLDGVKAVKIVGKNFSELLGATILHNDLNSYLVTRDRPQDSVLVNHSGDTLVFEYYSGAGRNNGRYNRAVKLRINLPENIPVVASSCQIDYVLGLGGTGNAANDSLSVKPYSPISFYLSEGAVLNLGSEPLIFRQVKDTAFLKGTGIKGGQSFIRDSSQMVQDSLAAQFEKAGGIYIYANNSKVNVQQPADFNVFNLTMDENSVFALKFPIKAKSAEINMDPKTHIEGDYRGVKSIRSLVKD